MDPQSGGHSSGAATVKIKHSGKSQRFTGRRRENCIIAADMFPMSSEMKAAMAALGKLELTARRNEDEDSGVKSRHEVNLRENMTARESSLSAPRRLLIQSPRRTTVKQRGTDSSSPASPRRRHLSRANTVDMLPLSRAATTRMARAHTIDVVTPDLDNLTVKSARTCFSKGSEFDDSASKHSMSPRRCKSDIDCSIGSSGSPGSEKSEYSFCFPVKRGESHGRTAWENLEKNRKELFDKWLPW